MHFSVEMEALAFLPLISNCLCLNCLPLIILNNNNVCILLVYISGQGIKVTFYCKN